MPNVCTALKNKAHGKRKVKNHVGGETGETQVRWIHQEKRLN